MIYSNKYYTKERKKRANRGPMTQQEKLDYVAKAMSKSRSRRLIRENYEKSLGPTVQVKASATAKAYTRRRPKK